MSELSHYTPRLMLAAATSPDIVFLFAGAEVVLYVASRAAADALTSTADPSPGRMALAQWMPVAWAALLATAAGHSEVGIGLVVATSVAALSLNLGVLLLLSPHPATRPAALHGFEPVFPSESGDPASADAGSSPIAREFPVPAARAWPFVLAAALLAFLAGFTGFLNWLHALMMLLLGGCVWTVWHVGGSRPADMIPIAGAAARHRVHRVQLLLALALGGVGAWIGFQAVLVADAHTRIATSGLIAAAVLSPLLVLPVLGTGAIAAQNGRMNAVIATLVGIVLLNVCALLPMVVLCDYARQLVLAWHAGSRELRPMLEALRPVPFPLAVWRVDTVLLMVLGLLLVPMSLNRWALKKGEGFALAMAYVAYLLVSTALAVRL